MAKRLATLGSPLAVRARLQASATSYGSVSEATGVEEVIVS